MLSKLCVNSTMSNIARSTALPTSAFVTSITQHYQQNQQQVIFQRAYSATSDKYSNTAPGTKADKLLFTPGPLLTSYNVKAAMLHDLGSRDDAFIQVIQFIRSQLLVHAGVSPQQYTTIPIQGSGTFGVEAVLTSVVPKNQQHKLLIIANGAYGVRMHKIAQVNNLPMEWLNYADDEAPKLDEIEQMLKQHPSISHVAVVHSETTSGIVNDITTIGKLVKKYNKTYIVDAMSSFGAVPVDFEAANISYLVSSANKCIQGSPGFAFVIANKAALAKDRGNARSLSLDIHAQGEGLDRDGQFRFTPPTHSLLAFRQALKELEEEGGVEARGRRYWENHRIVAKGLEEMGFKRYLNPAYQGPIITSFRYPNDSNWSFPTFYKMLNELGLVIYPGKVSKADCFRIGHIGHLFPHQSQALVDGIRQVIQKMNIKTF